MILDELNALDFGDVEGAIAILEKASSAGTLDASHVYFAVLRMPDRADANRILRESAGWDVKPSLNAQ